jgi:lipopolysaccharide/colanic/teichoic acid biosynthesis glycosyltransferase
VTSTELSIRVRALSEPRDTRARVGKRAFDITLASLLLGLLTPVLLGVWILIRLTSPGGAIFRQTRIGRHGRPFVMYKFRTMQVGCPDDIHRAYVRKLLTDQPTLDGGAPGIYKLHADPRLTRIGHLLGAPASTSCRS